jgi:hypothetical protein
MREVSATFDPTVSHTLAIRATLLSTGDELPIISGSVKLDSNAEIRATADLEVADDGTLGWVPTDASSPLAPFGEEIRLERGIYDENGVAEMVSIAIVRIEQVHVQDSGEDLQIQVTGLDRAATIIDTKFETPHQIASGTNAMDAIETLLIEANPLVETDFPTTGHTTPLLVAQEGDSHWSVAQGLAKWLGAELYFDGDGIAVVRTVSQVVGPPVLTLAEGEGGLLVEVDANWDREQAFNRVIVTGENASLGVLPRGVATDNDPQSPTYYFGPFGAKSMFWSSDMVTTSAQAGVAAEALLAKNLGIGKTVNFGAVVHPALEPLDAITIARERAGISAETLTVDSLDIPLSTDGVMSGSCRTVRVVE